MQAKQANIEFKEVNLSDLNEDPYNPRKISDDALAGLEASITRWGVVEPIIWNEKTGNVVGGHQRLRVLRKQGIEKTSVVVVSLEDKEEKALNLTLNNHATQGQWTEGLGELIAELKASLSGEDQVSLRIKDLQQEIVQQEPVRDPQKDPDEIPPPPTKVISKPGMVYQLGRHRLMCGDSTCPEKAAKLFDGQKIDLTCTDPPYCSGGFQESGKAAGSVGTNAAHKQVANDRLSTRGYQALLKASFLNIGSEFMYAFTDWRMWIHLFDIFEGSGYGVRSMVVWDKESMGMGRGWRAQHELVMWGCKSTPVYPKGFSGFGNVIQCKRTGNKNHTTEKPVELMEKLLDGAPFCKTVADPFCGSGTTLIACEISNRQFFGFELDPGYCDTVVRRWEDFTGKKAEVIS